MDYKAAVGRAEIQNENFLRVRERTRRREKSPKKEKRNSEKWNISVTEGKENKKWNRE